MTFPIVTGRVWKFGDNISTDLIMPGFVLSRPDITDGEASQYIMNSNRPGWAKQVNPGDMIVGGKNFGCGSGRPTTHLLNALGISCIVAESIARVFFRNCIGSGFPVFIAPGIQDFCSEGNIIEINFESGKIENRTVGKTMKGEAMPSDSPPFMILKAGGLTPLLEKEFPPQIDPDKKN